MGRTHVLHAFAGILSIFVWFHQVASTCILSLMRGLPSCTLSQLRLINRRNNSHQPIIHYIQTVADSSISLILSFTLLNFNQKLIQLSMVAAHKVHHLYLSMIFTQLKLQKDYSQIIIQNNTVYFIMMYVFVLSGYLGLTIQLNLAIDLIYVLSLPTILIYKVLSQVYRLCIRAIKELGRLLNYDNKYDISSAVKSIYVSEGLKTVYYACTILLVQIAIIVAFYYLWLSLVIVFLRVFTGLLGRIVIIIDNIGNVLAVCKGIVVGDKEEGGGGIRITSQTIGQKIRKILIIYREANAFQMINFDKVIGIFYGTDLFEDIQVKYTTGRYPSLSQIYNCFIQLTNLRQ